MSLEELLPKKLRPASNNQDLGRIQIQEKNNKKFLTVDGDVCFELCNIIYHDGMLEIIGLRPEKDNKISESGTFLSMGSVNERIVKVTTILDGFGIKSLIRLG